ncbi:zf-HC2 domain-containing protein [bacterium]|nr:zf-HC2 domain-containing protein [bacterium]
MDCEESQKLLPDYVSHDVGPEMKRELEAHIRDCPACQAWLTDQVALERLIQADSVPDKSEQGWDMLEKRIMSTVQDVALKRSRGAELKGRIIGWSFFNPAFLRYGLVTSACFLLITSVILFLVFPRAEQELTPIIAARVCDDPEVWGDLLSSRETETTLYETNLSARSENYASEIYLTVFSEEKLEFNSFDADDQELDLWSLVDKLDDNGIQLLKAALATEDRV